ncbi:hypothetical protein TNCV_4815041 [Trichonephila clavipes]|nr:hypothetical protein TNCV_4815041 [Trichonephila clavipes]
MVAMIANSWQLLFVKSWVRVLVPPKTRVDGAGACLKLHTLEIPLGRQIPSTKVKPSKGDSKGQKIIDELCNPVPISKLQVCFRQQGGEQLLLLKVVAGFLLPGVQILWRRVRFVYKSTRAAGLNFRVRSRCVFRNLRWKRNLKVWIVLGLRERRISLWLYAVSSR